MRKKIVFIPVISALLFINGCHKKNSEGLTRVLSQLVSAYPEKVAVYLYDLRAKKVEFAYNADEKFASASLVKIPVMIATFSAVKEGHFRLSDKLVLRRRHKVAGSGQLRYHRPGEKFTVLELVVRMITESDNTATNILTEALGFDYINKQMEKEHLVTTRMNSKVLDIFAQKNGNNNYTTAREMGQLLRRIYQLEMVDVPASVTMLEILKQQKIRDRIPRWLPANSIVAHKTGLLHDVCHDVGIIFHPRGDFILCVLTRDLPTRTAKRLIASISWWSYQFYDGGKILENPSVSARIPPKLIPGPNNSRISSRS